jgi:hypothetical protein
MIDELAPIEINLDMKVENVELSSESDDKD